MGITKDNFDAVKRENYNLIYVGELSELQRQTKGATLEAVYEKFNIDHPADYKGHSLSVSDIVVLHQDGENTAHFVDSFGFTTLPEFLKEQAPELEAVQEEMQDTSGQDVQKSDLEEAKESPMVYRQSLSHAVEHGEKDLYRASWKLDIECKEAVEEAIRQNFDGMHLNTGAVKPLMEKYGSERIAFVLANTIQQEAWDGRFSRDNKAWASEFPIPENMANGIDLNRELIVSSHPAVLDGFVDMFRKEVMELEKEAAQDMAQEEMRDTSGQSVQKPEPESIEDGDEIIDLGDEREQVLAEMKKAQEEMQDTFGQSVQKPEMEDKEEPHETELAFQIADRYVTIQEVESSYDYSIMGADYKEIDGGMYDNPDVGIREALHDIVEDLKSEPDYNGAKGNIREDDELIPMDYDELMKKAEAANRIQPQNTQSSVVEDFKAKTDELFHDISEMNPSEIEETVKCHVQAKIEEYDIDAQIVDVAVVGSRCRGLEREGSDLDVVVELSTKEREDDLFNAFNNSDGIYIGDIKVDINPITTQRTGSLENYLPQVEEYLESVRQAREQEPKSIFGVRMFNEERFFENTSGMDAEALCKAYAECEKPFVEMGQYGKQIDMGEFASIQQGERMSFSVEFDADNDEIIISDGEHFEHKGLAETLFPEQKEKETEITLMVSECSEFHNYGEFYENIPTVDEAIAIWRQIPPERLNAIPSIGINLHVPGTEPFEDSEVDILSGKRIDLGILDHIPDIKNSPQAMEVIAQLVAKMPEMEIDGVMSEEMEARVWELRMPDLGLAGQLAVELDRFVHDYDTYSYRNDVHSMTENVTELTEMLEQGNTEHITEWLNEAISEGIAPEEEGRAKELLEKLAEYKPLAKIEEMEEQNYNMIDNVLNNGAEKAQREANKKEQEQPAARVSLKARLAEKKAQVAGHSGEHDAQENIKKNQREM